MPYDFDSPVVDGSHHDAGAEINAALADSDNVRIAGNWLNVRTTIRLPSSKQLYAESPSNLIKLVNGPLIVLEPGGFQELASLNLEGNAAAGFGGANILIEPGGGWQKFTDIQCMRSEGHTIEMVEPHAGHMASFANCLCQCADITKAAIKLPDSEPTTGGLRRFFGCSGGGAMLIDLAGSNATMMIACDTYRVRFGDGSNYGIFNSNRFAIPSPERLEVRGFNHRFVANLTSSKVWLSNATHAYENLANSDAGIEEAWHV